MDCVHHSNYIRWFEEARLALMQQEGFPYEELEQGGIISPVLSVQCDYRKMCRFGETVQVKTQITQYTGTRITFSYLVCERESGEVRCTGETTHCFLKNGRPVSLKKAMPEFDKKVRDFYDALSG